MPRGTKDSWLRHKLRHAMRRSSVSGVAYLGGPVASFFFASKAGQSAKRFTQRV